MPHKHAKGVPCTEACKKGYLEINTEMPSSIPPTRLITNIVNALFTVFPKLGEKLNKRRASRLLTMMTTSGMLGSTYHDGMNMRDSGERIKYVDYMIRYNDDVRSIARFVGIRTDIAVDFVRCCFSTNKSRSDMYPYTPWDKSAWRYHKHLVTKFGESIAQCITESMIGVIPIIRITDNFGLLNRISKNMAQSSNAKFFILEGCNYVINHEDQRRVKVPGQAEMIFIDEFINYLRELDEARYMRFQDEIADLLEGIQSPFMPDCNVIIGHLDMSRFDEDIAIARASFEKLLDKPSPEPVPESIPESKKHDEKIAVYAAAFAAATPDQLPQFLAGLPGLPGFTLPQPPLGANGIPIMLPLGGPIFQAVPLPQMPIPSVASPVHVFRPSTLQVPHDGDDSENEGGAITPRAEDSDQDDH